MNKEIQNIAEVLYSVDNNADGIWDKHNISDYAEALYNAGYRKTFTSDFASDTQKAFKAGYQKAIDENADELMNKEKVKEALKRCISTDYHNDCFDCPYSDADCSQGLFTDILQLINGQEAEIERIKCAFEDYVCKDDTEQSELRYKVAKLEQANEQLEKDIITQYKRLEKQLQKTIKRAVKEFAEKLKSQMRDKEYMGVHYKQRLFSDNDIDDLLAEYENEH